MLTKLINRQQRDEKGNLIVATALLMVLVLLGVAITARTTGAIDSARDKQDIENSLSAADAGIAHAIFLLDQGQNSDFNGTQVVNGNTVTCKGIRISANKWTIRAKGLVNGVPHAAEVTVTRKVAFPYAIFANQTLRLNGNSGGNITSYNSLTGEEDTGNAFIGSNHAIIINGGGGGDGQHYYSPNGSCSGCPNGTQVEGPNELPEPSMPTSGFQACPVNGLFGPVINGAGGTPFLCNDDVSFTSGSVTVANGPVKIYISANHELDLSDTQINIGGSAKNFIIYKAGTGEVDVGNGSHAGQMTGVLYAPSSRVRVNGGHMSVKGSITLNELDAVNGGPNFEVRYDDSVSSIVSEDWKQSNWHEIPSSGF